LARKWRQFVGAIFSLIPAHSPKKIWGINDGLRGYRIALIIFAAADITAA
jgi:hypothetical protein